MAELLSHAFSAGKKVIEMVQAAKDCANEGKEMARRIQSTLGLLKEAVPAFEHDASLTESLLALKKLLEKVEDLLKLCLPQQLTSTLKRAAQVAKRVYFSEKNLKTLETYSKELEDIRRHFEERMPLVAEQKANRRHEQTMNAICELAIKITLDKGTDPSMKRAKRLLEGQVIDEELVEFEESLGSGSFGVVMAGTYYGKQVAIKRALGNNLSADERESFSREARTHYGLRHDRIVQVIAYRTGSSTRPPCLVMERMERSLYHFLGINPAPLDLSQALPYVIDICEGLKFLHQHRVIHRDVKSHNILLRDGGAKLSDFGLAHVCSTIGRSTGNGRVLNDKILANKQGGDGLVIGQRLLEKADDRLPLTGEEAESDPARLRLYELVRKCGQADRKDRPVIQDVLAEAKSIFDSLSGPDRTDRPRAAAGSPPTEPEKKEGRHRPSDVRRRAQQSEASETKGGSWENWKDIAPPSGESLRQPTKLGEGKSDEVGRSHEGSMDTREKALEPDYPAVATMLNTQAEMLKKQGKLAVAESLYEHCQAIEEEVLGPEHLSLATTLNNRAELLRAQGEYAKAVPLNERATEIWMKDLGREHPTVAKALNDRAGLLEAQGKYNEADRLYLRAIEIGERTLGPDHPDQATWLNNWARLLEKQGEFDEADRLYARVIEIYEKNLGPHHPDVAASLNKRAELLSAQYTPAQARSWKTLMARSMGRVEYVFSSMTGTLTQNLMKFKRCSVGGDIYGELDQKFKDIMPPAQLEHCVDAPPLSYLAAVVAKATDGSAPLDFALCLALNHTVMAEYDPWTDKKKLQAESPDEEALVDGGKMLGIEFVNRSPESPESPEWVDLEFEGRGLLSYEIILTIPFDSDRKRMSVVVKTPDGSYILYCKGADNIIMDRASSYLSSDKETVASHLGVFSNDGLRTLVLAKKEMTKEFFDEWYERYSTASIATGDRAEQIAEVAKEVEIDLVVVGAAAIEDKLQDDVPATIADLGKAGVQVWMLTGVKMEAATNIGYRCRLLEPAMSLIKLKEEEGDPQSVNKQLKKLMTHFYGRLFEDKKKKRPANLPTSLLEQPPGSPPLSELTSDHLALVVDGPSLARVYGDPEAERMLLTVASMCKSVIACRVSPSQKRLAVRLQNRGIVPTPVTLAIGDGGNDVGMIQEAKIGVGISCTEGRQAMNNSDFTIAQFRFLKRLLRVRICKVKLSEAETFYVRATEIWEEVLGPDHLLVAKVLNNRAVLLKQQGKYSDAMPLFERALSIRKKKLGENHPDTVASKDWWNNVRKKVEKRWF